MTNEELKKLAPVERLKFWVKERHQIYLKRQAGLPKPWSTNEIMQTCYFTNVYRELDKTTVWFREQFRDPLKNAKEVVFGTIAFRWFNWIPTGRLLQGSGLLTKWNTEKAMTLLGNYQKQNDCQLFTGAFNISNSGSKDPKLKRVCEAYIQPAWDALDMIASEFARGRYEQKLTLEQAFELIGELPGLGGSGFMAAQVICDLAYTPWLENCKDWWTWCSPGPGSKRGVNCVLGRDPDGPDPPYFLEEIAYHTDLLNAYFKGRYPRLHARDVQNCFCELSKFERVLWGRGKPKRNYPGA